MARSIGDWFADHVRQLPDNAPDDEAVGPQAPWDLQSSETMTQRSERRDAVDTPNLPSRQAKTRAQDRAAVPAQRRLREIAPVKTAHGTKESVRQTILAAIQANPRVDPRSLAASLTRHGTPVRAADVAAVKDALSSPFKTVPTRAVKLPATPLQAMTAIHDVVRANPHLGKKALVALLRARGIAATKAEIASALAHVRTPTPGKGASKTGRRPAGPIAGQKPKRTVPTKQPARTVKISACAQKSRTAHETPLCSSCGMRVSIYSGCRCS